MTYIVVGSVAAKRWWKDFPRDPKDFDVFTDESDIPKTGDLKKYDRVEAFWHPLLDEWPDERRYPERPDNRPRYALPNELYTIKVSHSYWEIGNAWNKHIFDILWMQDRGCELLQPLHDLLYEIWTEKHGKKKVDLNYDKQRFFDDAVRRIYDHDSVHQSVAYGDHPMWMECLKSGEEVAMDMAKIKSWPLEKQVKLYREEIAATALERWIIPSNYTYSAGAAWKKALRKTIVSLTKNWSAQFLVTQLRHFATPDDYVARHLSKQHKLIVID